MSGGDHGAAHQGHDIAATHCRRRRACSAEGGLVGGCGRRCSARASLLAAAHTSWPGAPSALRYARGAPTRATFRLHHLPTSIRSPVPCSPELLPALFPAHSAMRSPEPSRWPGNGLPAPGRASSSRLRAGTTRPTASRSGSKCAGVPSFSRSP